MKTENVNHCMNGKENDGKRLRFCSKKEKENVTVSLGNKLRIQSIINYIVSQLHKTI